MGKAFENIPRGPYELCGYAVAAILFLFADAQVDMGSCR